MFALIVAACAAQADKAPPGGDYQMVSDLVALPEFIPGLGSLYVQPATLPAGPFLAYDRSDRLVSTIYMIPLEDIEAQKGFDALGVGGKNIESVDLYYNAGHPGVERRITTSCSGMFPKAMPTSSSLLGRRAVLRAGGLVLAGLAAPAGFRSVRAGDMVEIRLRSDTLGTKVWYDPIGLLVEPGQTVRWVNESNVHTSTAYHPANGGHALRIPKAAEPWDSGYLVEPGDRFEVTLTVPGVYDYFCAPHAVAGMVGRIIVGRPGGPGTLPFDYFAGDRQRATGVPSRKPPKPRSRRSRRS